MFFSYGKKGPQESVTPKDGKWRSVPRVPFVNPKPLKAWALLDMANLSKVQNDLFIKELKKEAANMGMNPQDPGFVATCRQEQFESKFRELLKGNQHMRPEIIVVIMVDKSSDIYQKAKLIGDTEKSIPTQFVLKRNATGKGPNDPKVQQTIHNIILKVRQ